jgi:hypothetical protein
MADLLLGRRQQPILSISDQQMINLRRELINSIDAMDFAFDLRLQFENMSIVWAEDCRWGMIAWIQNRDRYGINVSVPGSHLLSFVDVHDPRDLGDPRDARLRHFRDSVRIGEPFESDAKSITLALPLRDHMQWFEYTWRAALYVTAKNSLPVWYQINIHVNGGIARLINPTTDLTESDKHIELVRLTTERPVVAWE